LPKWRKRGERGLSARRTRASITCEPKGSAPHKHREKKEREEEKGRKRDQVGKASLQIRKERRHVVIFEGGEEIRSSLHRITAEKKRGQGGEKSGKRREMEGLIAPGRERTERKGIGTYLSKKRGVKSTNERGT